MSDERINALVKRLRAQLAVTYKCVDLNRRLLEAERERAEAAASAADGWQGVACEQRERADGLQRVVDAARGHEPVAIVIAAPDFNGGMTRPIVRYLADANIQIGTKLYAAPVPAQPAVVPEAKDIASLAAHYYDGPYRDGRIVALCEEIIERMHRADAILSTTEGRKDE